MLVHVAPPPALALSSVMKLATQTLRVEPSFTARAAARGDDVSAVTWWLYLAQLVRKFEQQQQQQQQQQFASSTQTLRKAAYALWKMRLTRKMTKSVCCLLFAIYCQIHQKGF